MSFAGVSLIRDGRLWPSGSAINDAGAASGYHLLVVEGYSCVKHILKGSPIESRSFKVGGYLWFLKYYPNGSPWAEPCNISAALVLAQDVAKPVKAEFMFCFIDQSEKQESTVSTPIRFGGTFRVKSRELSCTLISKGAFENSKHLQDHGFTLRCDVVVVVEDVVNATGTGTVPPFVTVPPPDMQRHFTDLLTAKEGTDVKFKVGGQTIAAHRCVLAARSRVFKAELFGLMKEGTPATSAIHIEDMEPRVFRAILAFIYSDSEPEMDDDEDATSQWQHLLVAADRYDLHRLKLMCEDKLCGFICVNTVTATLALAEQHCCEGLKMACYNFLGVPGNLRAAVATDGFDDLITSYPSVMKELIGMLAP